MYDILEMKNIAKMLNNRTYTDYFYRLMLLARSVFKWENLPNGIDEKWIERFLFYTGRCMFYKDPINGFMVAKCTEQGINYYDEPTDLLPVATGYSEVKSYNNETECVLINNNDIRMPTLPTIELYAYRLAELSRTIDININAQKTPVLIKCSERKRLTLKNVYKQWQGNEPVIFGDDSLDAEGMEVLKTDAPIVFDKLQIQKHALWNECMTFLGINNANQDKRERLVSDEVDANDEQIEISAQTMLKARKEACKRINELFGLDIKVSLRTYEEIKGSERDSDASEDGSEEDSEGSVA